MGQGLVGFGERLDLAFEHGFGIFEGGAVEDVPHRLANFAPLFEATGETLSILAQMKLAALPRQGGKNRSSNGPQSGVVVADEQLDSLEASPRQILQRSYDTLPTSIRTIYLLV